jgi:hypothetical protein
MMPKFMLAFSGGATPEGMTEEEIGAVMGKWQTWMGGLGEALVDPGNPFGGSKSTTDSDAGSGLSGYSLLNADNLDAAVAAAKECPIHDAGGTVMVYETMEM